jgi:hypothetical protein
MLIKYMMNTVIPAHDSMDGGGRAKQEARAEAGIHEGVVEIFLRSEKSCLANESCQAIYQTPVVYWIPACAGMTAPRYPTMISPLLKKWNKRTKWW